MTKKLITATWAVSVEIDLPDDADIDQLQFGGKYGELEEKILKDASNNVNWKGGEITSVDEIYDDVAPPNFDHDARFDEGGEFHRESNKL